MTPRRHEEMGLLARALIAVAILVGVTLFLFVVMMFVREEAEGQEVAASQYDAKLIALDKQALDQAYQQQMVFVFSVWMKDPSVGQPGRATVGFNNARRAYILAMKEIEKREQK